MGEIFVTAKSATKITHYPPYRSHMCAPMLCCAIPLCLQLSKESFPPCMRHLHESLRRDHHLKHFARLQYGLFLKNIGLTLEQALAFWRAEFTKKMDVDKVQIITAVCSLKHNIL